MMVTITVGGTWVSAWSGLWLRRMISSNAMARRRPRDELLAVGAAGPVDRFGLGVERGGQFGAGLGVEAAPGVPAALVGVVQVELVVVPGLGFATVLVDPPGPPPHQHRGLVGVELGDLFQQHRLGLGVGVTQPERHVPQHGAELGGPQRVQRHAQQGPGADDPGVTFQRVRLEPAQIGVGPQPGPGAPRTIGLVQLAGLERTRPHGAGSASTVSATGAARGPVRSPRRRSTRPDRPPAALRSCAPNTCTKSSRHTDNPHRMKRIYLSTDVVASYLPNRRPPVVDNSGV